MSKPCQEEFEVPSEVAPTPSAPTMKEKPIEIVKPRFKPKTKLFPPSPAAIAAGGRLFIVEYEKGEGFLDFLYLNANNHDLTLIVELDGDQWLPLKPIDVRSASTGLGIDGWMGYLGSQIYSDEETAYGITVVPIKDTAPFYQTLRVWVENTGLTIVTLRRTLIGWRLKQ